MYAETIMDKEFGWKKNPEILQNGDDSKKTREISFKKKTDTDYPPLVFPTRPKSPKKSNCDSDNKKTSVHVPVQPQPPKRRTPLKTSNYGKETRVISKEQFESLPSLNEAYGTKALDCKIDNRVTTSSEVRVVRQMDTSDKNKTVLVVGDNEQKLNKLVGLLEKSFSKVLVSRLALNVEFLFANTKIDYVICAQNLTLEDKTGFDLINEWKRKYPSIVKGIVYTSRSDQEDTFTEVKQSSDVLELISSPKHLDDNQ